MALSSDLASQFAKITNDSDRYQTNGTLRGNIVKYDESLYVKLDGSSEITPISRTVEVAEGDRVEVTIQNHAATVTGNLTDPSIGIVRAGQMESRIEQTAEEISLAVSELEKNLSSSIKLNADKITMLVESDNEFSKFQQTVEGFEFMNKGGTVKIESGCLNLTGSITFSDFEKELADQIEETEKTADTALEEARDAQESADNAQSTANSAASGASYAGSLARSIANGTYIGGTFINGKEIQSPSIKGNEVMVYGTFQTKGFDSDGAEITSGYMGAAQGSMRDENGVLVPTYGVALSNTWEYDDYSIGNSYVIVTNGGVRLQYKDNRVIVSEDGVYITTPGKKAYYDTSSDGSGRKEIGSGSAATAVWG